MNPHILETLTGAAWCFSLILDQCIYDDAEIARVKYLVAHGHQVSSPMLELSRCEAYNLLKMPSCRSLHTLGPIL